VVLDRSKAGRENEKLDLTPATRTVTQIVTDVGDDRLARRLPAAAGQ